MGCSIKFCRRPGTRSRPTTHTHLPKKTKRVKQCCPPAKHNTSVLQVIWRFAAHQAPSKDGAAMDHVWMHWTHGASSRAKMVRHSLACFFPVIRWEIQRFQDQFHSMISVLPLVRSIRMVKMCMWRRWREVLGEQARRKENRRNDGGKRLSTQLSRSSEYKKTHLC